jgi:hypothetical protein
MILEVMGLTNGYCYHYYVTGQKCRFKITSLAWLVGQGSLVSVVPTFDPGGKTQHTGEMANPDHAGSLWRVIFPRQFRQDIKAGMQNLRHPLSSTLHNM